MSIASPGADAPTGMLVDALGGAAALSAAAIEKTVATGWRRHPGWGTDPSKAEHVADFTSTLELDLSAPRYRLSCQSRTYLVPTDLDFTEVGNGSRGHVTGVDFMFDPRPVDMDIPSWRVAARLRHLDLTSPLRLARKLTAAGADVTAEPGPAAGGRDTTILTLREFGRPPVRLQTDAVTGRPSPRRSRRSTRLAGMPSSACPLTTSGRPAARALPGGHHHRRVARAQRDPLRSQRQRIRGRGGLRRSREARPMRRLSRPRTRCTPPSGS